MNTKEIVAVVGMLVLETGRMEARAADVQAKAPHPVTPQHARYFVNVKDFGAVGDGVADDTDAIQKAINSTMTGKGNPPTAVIYLPPGTYTVTRRLILWMNHYFVGDPAVPATLRLPANTPGYRDAEQPNAMLQTWNGYSVDPWHPWFYQLPMPMVANDLDDREKGGSYNNNFRVLIANLRFVIEPGNPGAVGLHARLAQLTTLENLHFKATDALVGIWGSAQLYKNIVIEGFHSGFRAHGPSVFTFRNLTVRNARGPAVHVGNIWQMAMVNSAFENCASAIHANGFASFSLINTTLRRTAGPAIELKDGLSFFLANLTAEGVPEIIAGQLPSGPNGNSKVGTFVLGRCHTSERRGPDEPWREYHGKRIEEGLQPDLDLADAFRDPELLPWPSAGVASPGNVVRYGAVGDGKADDTAALQRAIEENEVVYLPMGQYKVTDTLHLKADTKLIGAHRITAIFVPDGTPGFDDPDAPRPVVATPDTPEASVMIRDLRITAKYDMNTRTPNAGGFGVLWRCGGRSLIQDVSSGGHYARMRITGHGGGVLESTLGGDKPGRGYLIEDAVGPARLYSVTSEGVQPGAGYTLRNVRNFTFVTVAGELMRPENRGIGQLMSRPNIEIEDSRDIVMVGGLGANWMGMLTSIHIFNSAPVTIGAYAACRSLYMVIDNTSRDPHPDVRSNGVRIFGYPTEDRAWSAIGLYRRETLP